MASMSRFLANYLAISLFQNEHNFSPKRFRGEFVKGICENILFVRYEWL